MEKRITTLEVRMDQTALSIDRLDHSILDLRKDMDNKFVHLEEKIDKRFLNFEEKIDKRFLHFEEKFDKKFVLFEAKFDQKFVHLEASISNQRKDCDKKFVWLVGIQIASLLAAMSWMGKIAQVY
jgi:uncharacterized coiled-coil protein SlyX